MVGNQKDLFAVILAGGSGTRFWPMGRQKMPKQFLDVTGDGTLLQQTIKRIKPLIPAKNIFIVTGKIYDREIKKQIKVHHISPINVLLEPSGKNTAPAICWAAARISKLNPNAVMTVLPSDHLILNEKKFLMHVKEAVVLANKNYLVTFGIVPTRPETGYGYLQTKDVYEDKPVKKSKSKITVLKKFVEKPSLLKAKGYIKKKEYLWNSGMFVWRCDDFLRETKQYLPAVFDLIGTHASQKYVNKVWHKLISISVDYGILEKAKRVAAVRAGAIGWSDLGSFESLMDVSAKDKNGNVLRGDTLMIDSRDSLVFSKERLTACIGLRDIIIIDTPDALLVCRRDLSQKVKDVVAYLKQERRREI